MGRYSSTELIVQKAILQLQILSFSLPGAGKEAVGSLVQDDAEGVHAQSQEEDQNNASRYRPAQWQPGQQIGGRDEDGHLEPESPTKQDVSRREGFERVSICCRLTS